MKQIYLKRGKEESLLRFHPWIFSGAIHHSDENITDGDMVRVVSASGDFLAIGHFQMGSIAVRILTFRDVTIDDDFWYARLHSAFQVRKAIGLANASQNNTYRLVHGEGDNLPGLIIDIYGSTAVMQAHSIGMHLARKAIAEQLVKAMEGLVEHVYYKNPKTVFSLVEPARTSVLRTALASTLTGYGGRRPGSLLTNVKTGRCSKNMPRTRACSTCFATQVDSRSMPCAAMPNSFIR